MSPYSLNTNISCTNSFAHKNVPELSLHLYIKLKNVYNPKSLRKLFLFVVIERIVFEDTRKKHFYNINVSKTLLRMLAFKEKIEIRSYLAA